MDNIEFQQMTPEQGKIAYYLECTKIRADIQQEKNEKKKISKQLWLDAWWESIESIFSQQHPEDHLEIPKDNFSLMSQIRGLLEASPDYTWYYISLLDTEFFSPYYPLADHDNKAFKGLSFQAKSFLQSFIVTQGIIEPDFIQRIRKTFRSSMNRLKGTGPKLAIAAGTTVAVTAVATAVTFGAAAIAAPTIATYLFPILYGSSGTVLFGSAHISAALALIGGGSLASGGLGMAGGVAAIAAAAATTTAVGVGTASVALSSSAVALMLLMPDVALYIAARTETIVKEVFLYHKRSEEQAVRYTLLLKEQISQFEHMRVDLANEDTIEKKQLKFIEQSIEYLKNVYKELCRLCRADK